MIFLWIVCIFSSEEKINILSADDVLGTYKGIVRYEIYIYKGFLTSGGSWGRSRGSRRDTVLRIRSRAHPYLSLIDQETLGKSLLLEGHHQSSKENKKSFEFSSENNDQRLIGELGLIQRIAKH